MAEPVSVKRVVLEKGITRMPNTRCTFVLAAGLGAGLMLWSGCVTGHDHDPMVTAAPAGTVDAVIHVHGVT